MLNILFWNLNRNSIEKNIVECLVENNIDIAIFTECNAIDIVQIEKNLGQMYVYIEGKQKDTKIKVILFAMLVFTSANAINEH